MLTSTVLAPDAFDRFAAFNRQNNGAVVEPAYLQQARLRVFYRTHAPNRWVAGYAVNARSPFRYLDGLAPDVRAETLRRHGLTEADLVEITLVSRDQRLPWTPGERLFYYAMSLFDALWTGRRVVLGGAVAEAHRRTQMQVLDRMLYAGELSLFGHQTAGWLYYATRWRAVRNLVWYGIGRLSDQPKASVNEPIGQTTE